MKTPSILNYINSIQELLDQLPVEGIESILTTLQEARLRQKQIFTMGNGGSASTASHFVCDLGKNTRQDGLPPFRVIGLADNVASISAYANDEGFENIFAQQLANLVQPGDVVIAISTSGNSPNVIRAVEIAHKFHAKTIGFTGFDGGQLGEMVDLHLHVPSTCIEQVEDVHLMLEHMICKVLREESHPQMLFQAMGREFFRRLDLRDLLRSLLEITLRGVGARSGSILVLDAEGCVVEGVLAYGGEMHAPQDGQLLEIYERGLAGWVVENRQAALIASTQEDPRWLRREWETDRTAARSAISVPLNGANRIVGVLTVVRDGPSQFTDQDLTLLTALTVCMSLSAYIE